MTPPKMARRFARWLTPALTPAHPIHIRVPRWLARILAAAGAKESR